MEGIQGLYPIAKNRLQLSPSARCQRRADRFQRPRPELVNSFSASVFMDEGLDASDYGAIAVLGRSDGEDTGSSWERSGCRRETTWRALCFPCDSFQC